MLLKGNVVVENKIKELESRVKKLAKKPNLIVIKVGNDAASEKYINNKVKMCEKVGIKSTVLHYKEYVEEGILAADIQFLNKKDDVTGILLQLPLPKHLNEDYLTQLISPEKDIDGFTTTNAGKLMLGLDCNVACTPRGIITLLKEFKIDIEGKDVLIINRSNIVGKPLAQLFLKENATVTIAHSKTKNLRDKMLNSDIVVTAVGKANMFNFTDFRNHTTIVDVSINFDNNGKMCGDVNKSDYDLLELRGCNITPVPGGVGVMTVLSLIEQTIKIQEAKDNGK